MNDGEALMQGRYIKLDKGNYVDLNIDNGHTGYKRIDVIAIEYTRDEETNIEEANLVVIKGHETQEEKANPRWIAEGDTVDGSASINQMPLYHVKIDGLSITDVTPVYTIGKDLQTAMSELAYNTRDLAYTLAPAINGIYAALKQMPQYNDVDADLRDDLERDMYPVVHKYLMG